MHFYLRLLNSALFFLFCLASHGQWQISQSDVGQLIDFDSSVAGVNSGSFSGSGYDSSSPAGGLDSDAWSVIGLSSGDLVFGGTGLTGDYARGVSLGGVSVGGVYAFNHGSSTNPDFSLGVQPGGSDFTPGHHILCLINATGDSINEVLLSYSIHVYNDQNRSSSLNLSYSSNGITFSAIPALNFSSKDTSDAAVSWSTHLRSSSILLNMMPGDSLFFRWSCDDSGGSGSRDEIALDNINVTLKKPGNLKPQISDLTQSPVQPSSAQSVQLSCRVQDQDGIDTVYAHWGFTAGNLSQTLGLQPAVRDSFYTPQGIPPQLDSTEVFYQIVAVDASFESLVDTSQIQFFQVLDPLPVAQLGDLIITELMFNPQQVSDSRGEYIEIYNNTTHAFNLMGYYLEDSGGDSLQISDRLIIAPASFLVLGRDSSTAFNGGYFASYQYSGFTLSNINDEVILLNSNADTIDQVPYSSPSGSSSAGSAFQFIGSNIQDNADMTLWEFATRREAGFSDGQGDKGSPGGAGHNQIVEFLVFENGQWNTTPDSTTSGKKALVRRGEMATLSSNASLLALEIEPTASLDAAGTVRVRDTLHMFADESGYSQMRGAVEGRVTWQSTLQSLASARWFNLAIPLVTTWDSVCISRGGRVQTLAQTSNDTASANLYYYDADQLNSSTNEGTWLPVISKHESTHNKGFSFYLGQGFFGTLPQTLSATGRVVDADVQVGLGGGIVGNNYNFIANPFPCAIDWDEIVADNSGLGTSYFIYDDGPDSMWVAYNSAAGITSNGAGPLIAPGQGFFVNRNGLSNITIEKDSRNLDSLPSLFRQTLPPAVLVTLKTANGRTDYVYIGFNSAGSDSLNPLIDVVKRTNWVPGSPNIFTITTDHNYWYKFFWPYFKEKSIPLGYQSLPSSEMELSFNLVGIDPSWELSLEDKVANAKVNLRDGPYFFNSNTSVSYDRFIININTNPLSLLGSRSQTSSLPVFYEGKLLTSLDMPSSGFQISLSDLTGKVLYQREYFEPEAINIEHIDLPNGVYLLSVASSLERYHRTHKIQIR